MLLRYAILGLLDGQELHGYRIKSAFEEQVGPSWSLNYGQIYQTLKDLRKRGLVEGRFDRGTGHIGRWVYTITAKGRRALETWLGRSPRRPPSVRDEMLIRFLILDRTELEPRLAQIASQELVYREHVAQLNAQRKLHDADAPRGTGLLKTLAADAAIYHAEAHLRWLAHCTKLLRRNLANGSAPAAVASTRKPLPNAPKLKAAAHA
jgi:DNA-binding PadR family transcriptional regulator